MVFSKEWQNEVKAFFEEHNRWPLKSQGGRERSLCYKIKHCKKENKEYDQEFLAYIEQCKLLYPNRSNAYVDLKKKQIKDFFEQHGRFPLRTAEEEKTLYRGLTRYVSEASPSYDKEFALWAIENNFGNKDYVKQIRINEI